jgi:DNA invertase Pin-like site-specific DNA recombinase
MKLGYVCGCKDGDIPAIKRAAFAAAECDFIFEDPDEPVEGTTSAGLLRALTHVTTSDVLVVESFAEIGCTPACLAVVASHLRRVGASLHVLDDGIDTSRPGGEQVLLTLEAMAVLKSKRHGLRVKSAMAAARRLGARHGRPHRLTEEQIELAREEVTAGRATQQQMARRLGVCDATISRALNRQAQ